MSNITRSASAQEIFTHLQIAQIYAEDSSAENKTRLAELAKIITTFTLTTPELDNAVKAIREWTDSGQFDASLSEKIMKAQTSLQNQVSGLISLSPRASCSPRPNCLSPTISKTPTPQNQEQSPVPFSSNSREFNFSPFLSNPSPAPDRSASPHN